MTNYFFKPGQFAEIPTMDKPVNDDFLFNQGATKGLGGIKFYDYRKTYDSVDSPNINRFRKQIRLLKLFLLFQTMQFQLNDNHEFPEQYPYFP